MRELLTKLKVYERPYFDSVEDCGCPYDCSCRPSIVLKGHRLETDEELAIRVSRETATAEQQAVREKAEFERLKKLYG